MSDLPAGAEHASLPADLLSAASDKLLLLGARHREEDALAELYERYGGLVFTLALRIVGDRAVAEGVMQDAFLCCWNGREQFDDEHGSVASWLLDNTHRYAIDALGRDGQEPAAHAQPGEQTPNSLEPAVPPDGARERLLARARAEYDAPVDVPGPQSAAEAEAEAWRASAARADDSAPTEPIMQLDEPPSPRRATLEPIPASRPPPRPRRKRIRLASLGWAAALLFVLASGLFFGAWSATGPHATLGTEVQARLPGGRILRLGGTAAPAARARLYVLPDGRTAELAVDGLPPLPEGRVYQTWFAESGESMRTGGTFTVDPSGDAVARTTIPVPMGQVRSVAVTEEPAPGSPQPTGPTVLVGPTP